MADAAESRTRTIVITYFPMFIAVLSLITSIYNGYLNNRFVDLIQRNLGRAEYMRTCKDIIDAYFVVKARASALNAAGPAVSAAAQDDADLAVARLGALGTYLANLRGEEVRVQYTQLTTTLAAAVTEARRLQPAELAGRIRTADGIFAGLNADCIKSARDAPI